ncbi:MAG TPA: hypothetical protein VEK34_02250 [Methylocella sp.]|nr:hypothetical protein [Methylocella sp.]
MIQKKRRITGITFAATLLTAGAAGAETVIVERPMPAPVVEAIPVAQGQAPSGYRATGSGVAATGSGSLGTTSRE